jgi:hypothetical protein
MARGRPGNHHHLGNQGFITEDQALSGDVTQSPDRGAHAQANISGANEAQRADGRSVTELDVLRKKDGEWSQAHTGTDPRASSPEQANPHR